MEVGSLNFEFLDILDSDVWALVDADTYYIGHVDKVEFADQLAVGIDFDEQVGIDFD